MHEAGAWFSVSVPKVTIPAHKAFTDHFTLTVPVAVSPGEHFGAIVAAADIGFTSLGSIIEARVALITVVTVPGTVQPSANLSALTRSTTAPQQFGFDVTLSNTGNVLLTYAGLVVISDRGGHTVASLPLTPSDAYVVPSGHVALAAASKENIPQSGSFTAQATVTILANGKPVGTLTSQRLDLPFFSWAPILIWVGIALGAVLILGVVTWQVMRRLRRRRRRRAGRLTKGARANALVR